MILFLDFDGVLRRSFAAFWKISRLRAG